MKLTSDAGDFVELAARGRPGEADLALTVRVSYDGFVGETETWIERHEWFGFTQSLAVLEERRSGEAKLRSMSPGELNLTLKALDRLGHLGVGGLIAKRQFDREITLQFSEFAFDPSQIVAFARQARSVSESLGSPHSR